MTRARKPQPGEEHLCRREGTAAWHLDFTIQGQRFRGSTGTADRATAADVAHARYQTAFRRVMLGEARKIALSLEAAVLRHAEATSEAIGVRLVRGLGADTSLSALDDGRIDRLVAEWRAEGLAPATINRYLTGLQNICTRAREVWGVEVGTWDRSRHAQREPRGRETYLSHDQATTLLNRIVPHARPIVLFDLMTGLRKRNAMDLTWECVALEAGRASVMQKGGRPLSVVLIPEAVTLLQAVQPDPAERRGAVWRFANPHVPCRCPHCSSALYRGDPIRSIRRSFATAAGKVEISGRLRFHDMRHTFASWLLANTGDLKLVQDALGHESISSTARYAHLAPGRKAAAVEAAVSGLFQKG